MPHLLSGESVITVERQHVAVLVPAVLVAIVCLGVPLVLIQLVPGSAFGKSTGTVKAVADAVVAVLVVGWFVIRVLRWRCESYTLTTHRIILSKGVISQVSESIGLDRIQDTVVRRPFAERLIGAGSVEIQSAGRDGTEVLRLVPRPDRFYTQILQAIEDYRRLGATPEGAEEPGGRVPAHQGL
jgi:uncharacterized membrane protein YdbT with pleckstrin-like domain